MPDETDPKQYELEDGDQPDERDAPAKPTSSVHALDVCPNCGASMAGSDSIVCTRCGFDQKTLRILHTDTRVKEVEEREPAEGVVDAAPALVHPGRGDLWLSASIAVSSLLVLAVTILAGAPGLYHGEFAGEMAIGPLRRFVALLQLLVSVSIWTGIGFVALVVAAHIDGRRLGDWRLALTRVAAILAAVMLMGLLDFSEENYRLELVVELMLQAIAFAGLTMLLFDVTIKMALLVTAAFALLHVLLLAAGPLLAWVYSPA